MENRKRLRGHLCSEDDEETHLKFWPRRKRSPTPRIKPLRLRSDVTAPAAAAMAAFFTDPSALEVAAILIEMSNGAAATAPNPKKRKPPTVVVVETAPKAKKMKKTKQKSVRSKTIISVVPEIPEAIRQRIDQMGGYRVELVIQKSLTDTDLSKEHGRFLMPPKQLITHCFLSDDENTALTHRAGKSVAGIEVPVLGPVGGSETTLLLKKWKVGSQHAYCFVKNWNLFVQQNGLSAGDTVQIWSFRTIGDVGSSLRFSLVKISLMEENIIADGCNCVSDAALSGLTEDMEKD